MNISDKLSKTAKELPEKPAFIFESKETSYMELDLSVSKFAESLKQLGLQKGDHIALVVGNSPYHVIGLYGALRLGLCVIPINPLYTPNEMTYILQNGDAKAVITMDVALDKFTVINEQLPDIQHFISCESSGDIDLKAHPLADKLQSFTRLLEIGEATFQGPTLDKDETALILYTSGTTGNPKGAVLTHNNIYSNAQDVANYLSINESDRVIAALPMFHVFCLTVSLNAPLMNGGTVLIMPTFSPQEVFEITEKQDATIFAGVPTMYNYMLQYAKGKKVHLHALRFCISGGAAMPVALLTEFERTFNLRVSEGYGLSEASPVTCFNPLDRPRKPGSIGKSIVNVENKVLNELGEEVSVGEVGELAVRGPNVMHGYYKMAEETAAVIKDGWLYTGDMARMDDEGYFYIVDRKKDMIIVGGYNVYPREIEEVFYAYPSVSEVAAVGGPHPESGEAITCFVVTDDPSITEEPLLTFSKEHLAHYKIPSRIVFLEELPKNTTGKILRKQLRENISH